MNEKQTAAAQAVERGESIFLTGPGGTGKSFTINEIYTKSSKKVALTALTGCAALLIHPQAKTLHSWAGIGLGKDPLPKMTAIVRRSRKAMIRWISTEVLVIDEVSMMTPELFETLDEVGRKIRNDPRPFGGIQLVLSGDFYQLPPIQETVQFAFESPLWKKLNLITHELTEIVRQKDPVFQTILNEARVGSVSKESMRTLRKRLGIDYKKEEIQPTMLFTRRGEVDHVNRSHLMKLTTPKRIFSASTVYPSNTDMKKFDKEQIDRLDYNSSYSRELTLAVGAQVMLIMNKQELGLVNGSRGVVVGFTTEGLPTVKFLNRTLDIDYNTWSFTDTPGILRKQIPLILAYAITIHKAQGSTLDCALIDVGDRTFEYGQAYVALSRLKGLENLYIHDLSKDAFRAHPKVKEFYTSAL